MSLSNTVDKQAPTSTRKKNWKYLALVRKFDSLNPTCGFMCGMSGMFSFLPSMKAFELSISWCQSSCLRVVLLTARAVFECAFPSGVLLSWGLHFCPPNGRCSQQRCESRSLYATKNGFPCSERCDPGVAQNHSPLRQLCCQFLLSPIRCLMGES